MIRDSQIGCMAERREDNIRRWIEKFRNMLRDMASRSKSGDDFDFIENVVTSFYNDDIMTFTPKGLPVILPQKATVLDFAYEIHSQMGQNAKYARINGFLASIKDPLRRGDVVEIFTDPDVRPQPDWLESVNTYKARKAIRTYLARLPRPAYRRCPVCSPIPGEEVIGFRDNDGTVTLHKRDCPVAIRLAAQYGDDIVSVDDHPDNTLYPVEIMIKAVDRYHLLIDLVDSITNELQLAIGSINTETIDNIVTLRIAFAVHSFDELQAIIRHISAIPGVDEVKRK